MTNARKTLRSAMPPDSLDGATTGIRSITLPGELDELFEPRGVLGRGAHGVVYSVRERATGRALALKVVPMDSAAPRPGREVQLHSGLRHPHLLEVTRSGVLEHEAFLVTKRAEESLEDQLAETRDLAESWRALGHVSEALDHLHSQGVVHRDLKPSNILRIGDRWCLADLGLARSASLARLTMDGMILGTPGYMAPEQARGEEATAASDVFSLAILAYRVLEGRLPYPSTNPPEMLVSVARGALQPLRRAAKALPRDAFSLLARALSPDPRDRPESLEELFLVEPDLATPSDATEKAARPSPYDAIDGRLGTPGLPRLLLGSLALSLTLGLVGATVLVQLALHSLVQ